MGDISYTPTFRHVEYVDGEDRVRAEGPRGFNALFGAIEDDLAQLSTVVAEVDAKLDQLAVTPVPTTHRLTLPLRFVGGNGQWNNRSSGAAEVPAGESASGVMNLVLPDGVGLLSLRAVGQAIGTPVHISFSRQPAGGGQVDSLASIDGDDNPFDVTRQIDSTLATVDTAHFHYWIFAFCGRTAPDTPTVVISALQLTVSD